MLILSESVAAEKHEGQNFTNDNFFLFAITGKLVCQFYVENKNCHVKFVCVLNLSQNLSQLALHACPSVLEWFIS